MGEQEKRFTLSLDKVNKGGTAFFLILLGGVTVLNLLLAAFFLVCFFMDCHVGSLLGSILSGIIAIGMAAVMYIMYTFAPQCYRVGNSGVTVHRKRNDVCFGTNSLLSVELTKKINGCLWKNCGCDGFFGTWGDFSNKELGQFNAYFTRNDRLVLLRVAGGHPVVLSPDDPEGFMGAVQGLIDAQKEKRVGVNS